MRRAASNSTAQKGLRLFKDFFVDLMKDDQYDCLQLANDPDTVGLYGIALRRDRYKSIDEFLTDIDRLAQRYIRGSDRYEAAQLFKESCRAEADTIKKCPDCYESWLNCSKNFFECVCTQPHLVVFAKVDGFPIWPAKLTAFNDVLKEATIVCFGDHEEADIPFAQCFLYSKKIKREKALNAKQKVQLDKGYKEVKRHIKNVVDKFGSFVPAPTKRAISDVKQHLIDMIPGAYASEGSMTTDRHQPCATPDEARRSADSTAEHSASYSASSERDIDDADMHLPGSIDIKSEDLDDQHQPEDLSAPNELPIEMEIAGVVENYSHHDDEQDIGANDDYGDSGHLVMNGNLPTTPRAARDDCSFLRQRSTRPAREVKSEDATIIQNGPNRRKRQTDNSAMVNKRNVLERNKKARAAGTGNSSQANDENDVVILDDDDGDDQKELLKDLCEISVKIADHERAIRSLKEQKDRITNQILTR